MRILCVKDEGYWVAVSLEYGVAAQGEDIKSALDSFIYTFNAQVAIHVEDGDDPFKKMEPAPPLFYQMYLLAEDRDMENVEYLDIEEECTLRILDPDIGDLLR